MSSGFSYPQPIFSSPIYNPAFHLTLDASGYLTYDYAQTLYLDKNDYRLTYITGITPGTATQGVALIPGTNNDISGIGALSCSSLTVNGSSVSSAPTYVLSITPGTAANNKALVLGPSGGIGNITSLTATSITGTLQTAAQPNITSLGTLTSLTATSITGTLQTSNQPNITSLSYLVLDNSYPGLQTPAIQFWNSSTLTYQNFNHSSFVGLTAGSFLSSKAMTLDSSGIGVMPLGTSNSNCLRFYGGTLNRETMNIYRVSDTTGLVIASRTTSTSNSKIYPILNLISTDNPSTFVAGVSATAADLLLINWNDKPTGGFVSQSHRMCFDIGFTRPYKSGYPHTFGLVSSADAICIASNATTATPTTACLYIVSGTINKMLYNTNTPYTNASYGTANITLNSGNIYLKASNDLNGNSTAFDMPLLMVSSNASPVEVAVQINNNSNATSANSGYIGTTTNNDFVIMSNNLRRITITAAGRVGIGTATPVAPLQVSSTISYTWNSAGNVGLSVYRLRTDSGNTESATGTPITYTNVCCIFNGYIGCEAMVMQSDRRLKQEIADVPIERVECLYKSLKVQSYKWKAHPDKPKELGLIAQDVLDQGFLDLIARIPDSDPELTEGTDPWLEPQGVKLSVDYPKLSVYNMRMIQSMLARIEELESKLAALT